MSNVSVFVGINLNISEGRRKCILKTNNMMSTGLSGVFYYGEKPKTVVCPLFYCIAVSLASLLMQMIRHDAACIHKVLIII